MGVQTMAMPPVRRVSLAYLRSPLALTTTVSSPHNAQTNNVLHAHSATLLHRQAVHSACHHVVLADSVEAVHLEEDEASEAEVEAAVSEAEDDIREV